MLYDLFISYAKEDERIADAYRARLEKAGSRVFFAPQAKRDSTGDVQSWLLDELRASRNVLLLWSRFVDHSQWVALETSIYATMRLTGEKREGGLIAIDIGGPRFPGWLECDLLLLPEQDGCIEELLRNPEWPADAAADLSTYDGKQPGQVTRLFALAHAALFDLPNWTTRCRVALPRLGPNLALAQVRPRELATKKAELLLGDSFLLIFSASMSLAVVSWILGAYVFSVSYLPAWRGYVQREVLLTNSMACAAGILLALRVGIAGGISAAILSAVFGSTAALVMGWIGRPGPVASGVTAGVALGSCAALSLLLGIAEPSKTRRPSDLSWRAPAGVALAVGLVAAMQLFSDYLAKKFGDPNSVGRAGIATLFGGLIFLVIGSIVGWIAYGQQRGYFWRSSARFGFWVWCAFTALAAIAAIFVPFGNPFNKIDGVGVGLLSGAVLAGLITLVQQFVQPAAGDVWATPVTAACLLIVAGPVLRQFTNIFPDILFRWFAASAVTAFLTLLAIHHRRGKSS